METGNKFELLHGYLDSRIKAVTDRGCDKDQANYLKTGNDYDTVAETEWEIVDELQKVKELLTSINQ